MCDKARASQRASGADARGVGEGLGRGVGAISAAVSDMICLIKQTDRAPAYQRKQTFAMCFPHNHEKAALRYNLRTEEHEIRGGGVGMCHDIEAGYDRTAPSRRPESSTGNQG